MSIGRLCRHLDDDAIARVQAGIRFKPEPLKRQKTHRKPGTYRAQRRNAALHGAKPLIWGPLAYSSRHRAKMLTVVHPPVRPNERDRSRDLIVAVGKRAA